MKRKLLTISIILSTVLTLSLCLSSCGYSSSKFTGSKTSNDNQFLADFDVLNSTISATLDLKAGESVDTSFEVNKGTVDILVKNEKGTVAYRGDAIKSESFSIGIIEDGSYTFSITGRKAKGSVYFIKSEE